MRVRSIRLIALVLLATLCASPVWAQSADTGILGTVTDSSGAIVPGADVTITNASTGVAQSVVSGPNGTFEVRYLLPGDYTIQASLCRLPHGTSRPSRFAWDRLARLNFVLEVGNIGEVVDVEAQGLLLETQSGVTGNVVTSETLVNMPLSGRNFTQLGNLTAGVVASNTQFRTSGARGMYQQVSFDGVSALNNRGNNLFMYPSVDAVEEFKVQATNYTAEYGGHAGANVQLQLKSGSNSLHGSAFNYMRNDSLDARNYFAKAPTPKPRARSPAVWRRRRWAGPSQPDVLHGLLRRRPGNARDRRAGERADGGNAAGRFLRHPYPCRRYRHPRSDDRRCRSRATSSPAIASIRSPCR